MKTITRTKSMRRSRAFLLSVLCAGVVATFHRRMRGGSYATAYDRRLLLSDCILHAQLRLLRPPLFYYEYGPRYSRTVVRSGVR